MARVAEQRDPAARIVHVDNDPMVLTHARALLTGDPAGRTEYIDSDLHDIDAILGSPTLRSTIDLDQPVALLLIAVMHLVGDDDDPYGIVTRLLDALPSGSYLALSQLTGDFAPEAWGSIAAIYRRNGVTLRVRPKPDVERFFDGLELIEPGVQVLPAWRPDNCAEAPTDAQVSVYGGVARKP